MIALVSPASCIEKREHPGNKKRGFVVADRERSGKNIASFTGSHRAIRKKYRILTQETVCNLTALSDKTFFENNRIAHHTSAS
jgi:hypothetical protein